MSKLLIKNIKTLYGVHDDNSTVLRGKDLSAEGSISNAWLAIEDDEIIAFDSMDNTPQVTDWSELQVIDASGKFLLPAFCDSHTHTVHAAPREREFVDRINGLSYQEIADNGGGILNSAAKLRSMSEDQLFHDAILRLKEMAKMGVACVEIKSGYGLTTEAELKMLRVAKRLKSAQDIEIKTSFLGAHAYPPEFKENKAGYIDLILNEMLPQVAEENLTDYIDAFVESNYFGVEDCRKIVQAAKSYGMKAKLHVNQFTSIGGLQMAIEEGALSVDHLEEMTEKDIADLSASDTIATVLPSCSFFLSLPYAPAKELIENGAALAIASDFNPGSTPSYNPMFLWSLACIKMKLTPIQALNAMTINGACAMEMENDYGSVAVGKKANLILTKEVPSLAYIPYSFGHGINCIDSVFIKGKKQ